MYCSDLNGYDTKWASYVWLTLKHGLVFYRLGKEMASFKLRVIWGNDNSQRLTFSDGMPASLNVLSKKIENECGLQGQQFRLQYMDKDFNEFMNLTSVSDLADKDTVRVVFFTSSSSSSSHMPDEFSSLAHCNSSESCDADNENSSAETSDADILSSTSARSSLWPNTFHSASFPLWCAIETGSGQLSIQNQWQSFDSWPQTQVRYPRCFGRGNNKLQGISIWLGVQWCGWSTGSQTSMPEGARFCQRLQWMENKFEVQTCKLQE